MIIVSSKFRAGLGVLDHRKAVSEKAQSRGRDSFHPLVTETETEPKTKQTLNDSTAPCHKTFLSFTSIEVCRHWFWLPQVYTI